MIAYPQTSANKTPPSCRLSEPGSLVCTHTHTLASGVFPVCNCSHLLFPVYRTRGPTRQAGPHLPPALLKVAARVQNTFVVRLHMGCLMVAARHQQMDR